MGAYYNISNQTKRECIDPGKIDGGGIKLYPVVCGNTANLLTFLMATSWRGDAVTVNCDERNDSADRYYQADADFHDGGVCDCPGGHFKDVTLEAIVAYNKAGEGWQPIKVHEEEDSSV